MNDNQIKGDWQQVKGWAKEQWGRLTDDDLMTVNGQLDQLAGRIQERYGYEQEQALREVRDWNKRHSHGR